MNKPLKVFLVIMASIGLFYCLAVLVSFGFFLAPRYEQVPLRPVAVATSVPPIPTPFSGAEAWEAFKDLVYPTPTVVLPSKHRSDPI